jgi:hypothetical protein
MSEYERESENLDRTAGKSILLGSLLRAFRVDCEANMLNGCNAVCNLQHMIM